MTTYREMLDKACDGLVLPPTNRNEWQRVQNALRVPFEPWELEFRVGSGGQILAYVDRAAVVRRLNRVVGAENWTFEPEVVVQTNGHVMCCKGFLTICGITKASLGDAPDKGSTEQNKTSDSDSLKRGGFVWEIGLYLGELRCPNVPKEGSAVAAQAVVWLRQQYAEGRLWQCAEAAELYGCTYAEPGRFGAPQGAQGAQGAQGGQRQAQAAPSTQAPRQPAQPQPQPQPQQLTPAQQAKQQRDELLARARSLGCSDKFDAAWQHNKGNATAVGAWLDRVAAAKQQQREPALAGVNN